MENPVYLVGEDEVSVQFLSKKKALVDNKPVVAENRQQLLLVIGDILQTDYNVPPMGVMGLYDVVDIR